LTSAPKAHENLSHKNNIRQRNDTPNMIHVPIFLSETSNLERISEPVSVSVSFENGGVFDLGTLALFDSDQQHIPCHIKPLAYWPNKSIKWVRLYFQYSLNKAQQAELYLTSLDGSNTDKYSAIPLTSHKSVQLKENEHRVFIDTGVAKFQLNKTELGVFLKETNESDSLYKAQAGSLVLTDSNGIEYTPKIDALEYEQQAEGLSHFQLTIGLTGHFFAQERSSNIQFEAEITFYANKSYTKWKVALHNPNSMSHSGGTWDLGNENSLYFSSFNVLLMQNDIGAINYKLKKDANWQEENSSSLTLYQASSGGENWQSQNHVNHQGKVPITFKGCKYSVGAKQEVTLDRASPTVHLNNATSESSNKNLTFHIESFWQKFPKSIEISATNITLGLFPKQFSDGFELQPGEKKSDTFFIAYGGVQEELLHFEAPIAVTVSPEYLAKTGCIPFFANAEREEAYNAIINEGLKPENGFFHKRELIDEYGWRNFGDLYADHETLECELDGELISHYNNQYDPLYGFLKQYLATGNRHWLELANDLAGHVKNIDIYHTNEDRCEYNNGLFWHTDHYLPAETASHRTYSQRQIANAYQDHAGGGGPGGQHCYTTGLMLHYFITGDESSKLAVLQLTDWITHVYEGSGTLCDFLLAFKNRNGIGFKNIMTGKYPLDRGTGNYVTALIDAFKVSGKQSYLDHASMVIKNTVHPADDISIRHIDNIEECWFYTVFLQSIYRYLQIKEHLKQFDSSFNYSRYALLHYASWMVQHEKPYLDTPEVLEYPNHTWVAQDIRKANILYMASYYCKDPVLANTFENKAEFFYQYVISTLSNEPTKSFTRILSILMQNHGIKSHFENIKNTKKQFKESKHTNSAKTPESFLFDAFLNALGNTSVSKEFNWLQKRSSKVANLTKAGK